MADLEARLAEVAAQLAEAAEKLAAAQEEAKPDVKPSVAGACALQTMLQNRVTKHHRDFINMRFCSVHM